MQGHGQVWIEETNVNEPLMRYRKQNHLHQNPGACTSGGQAQRQPGYWLCGVGYRGGVNSIWAHVRNLGN